MPGCVGHHVSGLVKGFAAPPVPIGLSRDGAAVATAQRLDLLRSTAFASVTRTAGRTPEVPARGRVDAAALVARSHDRIVPCGSEHVFATVGEESYGGGRGAGGAGWRCRVVSFFFSDS